MEVLDSHLSSMGKHLQPLSSFVDQMMSTVTPNYWSFLNRGFGLNTQEDFMNIYPDFWIHTVYSSLFFISLFLLFEPCVKYFAPKWYSNLDNKKSKELPAYAVCMVHHI